MIKSATTRHAFYETDEKLTLEIFDKGVDPAQISVVFKSRSVSALYCLIPVIFPN